MRQILTSLSRALVVTALLSAVGSTSGAEAWESTVSPFMPGTFPEPRPLRAKYNFGWNGLIAATGDIRFTKNASEQLELQGTGGTVGLARTLWTFDVKHTGVSDARTLRPVDVVEQETLRKKQVTTRVTYTPDQATSVRDERRDAKLTSKTRQFEFPNILSMDSALFFLRTQPLNEGAVHRVVIYPATDAYLGTITVVGREKITVPTGTYDALKVDLQLNKIDKQHQLHPHKKFRHATIWLSNNPDRLILRIEAHIFIGTVFAELQSVEFENAKP